MASTNDNYKSLLNCKGMLLSGRLSLALEKLREHISGRPYLNGFKDRLEELSGNYDRMMHYFLEGSDDPRRIEYSKSYREETYRLIHDAFMAEYLKANEELAHIASHSEDIGEKQIFYYILFSPQWDDETEDQYVKEVVTSDEITGQLMTSAIMLSILMVFDFRKLRSLFRIYHEAASCNVRARGFVGAMLTLDEREEFWKEEQKKLVQKYCSSEEDVTNVLDFQKQIVYLLDTEKDAKKAREAFDLSDIMERNPKLKDLSMNKDFEFDSIDEFISPEVEEEISERLDESMRRYLEMEKAGSDLYFKGFRLMKDFEFFHSIDSWFTPFYAKNPILRPLVDFMDGNSGFLEDLEAGVPFCSSDTYSFALALSQMSKQMPFLKDMIKPGLFKPREKIDDEALLASLCRRKYLQDVYRFFMLAKTRGYFFPLFNKRDPRRITFLGRAFFNIEQYEGAHLAMCRFLARRKDYGRMEHFVYQNMPHTKEYRLIKVAFDIYDSCPLDDDIELLEPILSEEPDCRPAMKLLAKCYYMMGRNKEAVAAYRNLLRLYPNHVGLERRIAVCQIGLGEYDNALETLFRLDYQHPGDKETIRVLAKALFMKGSAGKALHYLKKILPEDQALSNDSVDDFCNAAFCKWVTGDNVGAIRGFARFLSFESEIKLSDKMRELRSVLLQHYDIGEEDFQLMTDAAALYKQRFLSQQDTTNSSPMNT